MTSCPTIASPNHPDIVLSTYDTTNGTYVVIGCRGFGKHVSDPTSVTCESGNWTQTPVLTCSTAFDTWEKLILGVAIACAGLVLLVLLCLCCYCCCCRRRRYYRHYHHRYYKRAGEGGWRERLGGFWPFFSETRHETRYVDGRDPPPINNVRREYTYIERNQQNNISDGPQALRDSKVSSDWDRKTNYDRFSNHREDLRRSGGERSEIVKERISSDLDKSPEKRRGFFSNFLYSWSGRRDSFSDRGIDKRQRETDVKDKGVNSNDREISGTTFYRGVNRGVNSNDREISRSSFYSGVNRNLDDRQEVRGNGKYSGDYSVVPADYFKRRRYSDDDRVVSSNVFRGGHNSFDDRMVSNNFYHRRRRYSDPSEYYGGFRGHNSRLYGDDIVDADFDEGRRGYLTAHHIDVRNGPLVHLRGPPIIYTEPTIYAEPLYFQEFMGRQRYDAGATIVDSSPRIVESSRYVDTSPRIIESAPQEIITRGREVVIPYTGRSSFRYETKEPLLDVSSLLRRSGSSYVTYGSGRRIKTQSSELPKIKVTDYDERSKRSSGLAVSRGGHYEVRTIHPSTSYFWGRKNFPAESDWRSSNRLEVPEFYSGKGRTSPTPADRLE